MSVFSSRVFTRLGQFNAALSNLDETVKATPPAPPALSRKILDELVAIAARTRGAADAIGRSFTLIDITALDIVDMQVRLQGEAAKLASALRDLGDAVEAQHFVRDKFAAMLVALDEHAQLLSAAMFPSAVQGLREVNVKLWEFEKIQWMHYTNILTGVVQQNKITPDEQVRIQAIADEVAAAFAEVNMLLNDLAEARASNAAALNRRLMRAPERLTASLQAAGDRLGQSDKKTLRVFGPVIKASKGVADDVAKLLRKLVIPVYPPHDALGPCSDFIPAGLYDSLGGVQAFALLNILSRMQHTKASGRPLLEKRHVEVTEVFPDRIYLEADDSLLDDLKRDTAAFGEAPAGLHKYNDGSFKQKSGRKGMLQLSYEKRADGRIAVDADIDLYRGVVPHLFGEVLVNHLTGNTTDQFRVRGILDDQDVPPIGGFGLLTANA
jgi:hypothetical protein